MSEALDLSATDSESELTVAEAQDDRLLTTRLPPMTPPPMRPPSVPPAGGEVSRTFPPSGAYRSDTSIPPQRSSWWRALMTATFPPPSNAAPAPTDERVVHRRIGATCAGMAIGFVILALALGLRGAEPAFSPAVAAAMVIARALISLGFLAFGYGLLRMAERFLLGHPEAPPASSSQLH